VHQAIEFGAVFRGTPKIRIGEDIGVWYKAPNVACTVAALAGLVHDRGQSLFLVRKSCVFRAFQAWIR
jgi:hypothetical protein